MENLPVFIRDVLVVKMTTLHIKLFLSIININQTDLYLIYFFLFEIFWSKQEF